MGLSGIEFGLGDGNERTPIRHARDIVRIEPVRFRVEERDGPPHDAILPLEFDARHFGHGEVGDVKPQFLTDRASKQPIQQHQFNPFIRR